MSVVGRPLSVVRRARSTYFRRANDGGRLELLPSYASSSIGRAAVSKAAGWGFDSLLACVEKNAIGWARPEEGPSASDLGVKANRRLTVAGPGHGAAPQG